MDKMLSDQILSKVKDLELRTRRLVDEGLAGHYHSVFKGRGMDFDSVREYVRGDEVKNIDWNVTARANRPYVKTYHEERELTLMLMIDVSASGYFGSKNQSKRELAAELGSILALSATRNNDKVGLLLFSDQTELYIPPGKGRSHILRLIREILFFEPKSLKTDLAYALDFVNRVIRRKAVTFLISDLCLPAPVDENLAVLSQKLALTSKHHDLICIHVSDPLEKKLPNVGLVELEDAETGQIVEINTNSAKVRKLYQEETQALNKRLSQTLQKASVDTLEVMTGASYMSELLNFFKTRERRLR